MIRKPLLGLAALLLIATGATAQEAAPRLLPAPAVDDPHSPGDAQKAVLAGGCYWGTQGVFEHVAGITKVVAGYTGGAHRGDMAGTQAAESVEITYDPGKISYGQILQIFFSVVHDPTELNRQGPDEGVEYRSDIFAVNDRQRAIAAAYIAQLGKAHAFDAPIVTKIDSYSSFQRVGFDQQDYLVKHLKSDYIVDNDLPKLAALKRLFPAFWRETPVTWTD